jgi:hypothetical protein
MTSVGGDLSCENLWRYHLLSFWRSAPDSLSDHSWVVVTLLTFPKSSDTMGLAASIATNDPPPSANRLPLLERLGAFACTDPPSEVFIGRRFFVLSKSP